MDPPFVVGRVARDAEVGGVLDLIRVGVEVAAIVQARAARVSEHAVVIPVGIQRRMPGSPA